MKDREAWRAAVHVITESDMTEQLNNRPRKGKAHGAQRHKLRQIHFAWITYVRDIEETTPENVPGSD